jgi:hypothetical protein
MATKLKITQTVIRTGITRQVSRVSLIAPFGIPAGISPNEFTQKGGILAGTGAGTFVEFPPGGNGQVVGYNSANPSGLEAVDLEASFPLGYIYGLELSNNVADATNDIDFAIGAARDSTDGYNLRLGSAITKRLDATFTAGTGGGGLDTGAKGNSTWYHVYLIRKDSDGTIDGLFSTSASAPTMPAGYTYKRRIGAIKTDSGGTIIPFLQYKDDFYWKSPPALDVDVSTLGTSRTNYTLASVPTGLVLIALVNVYVFLAANNPTIYISNPNLTDLAPSNTATPLGSIVVSVTNNRLSQQMRLLTNNAAQISARSDSANTVFRVATLGWQDSRE